MSHHPQTRLPLEPLRRAARADNLGHLSEMLGIPPTHRQLNRWDATGLPYYTADRLAARLGLHPAGVWPDFHDTPDYADGWQHPSIREGASA